MYQRGALAWTAIAVLGSAVVTLMPQGIRLLHNGTAGNEATRLVLSLMLTHWACALAALVWLAWRGGIRGGRRYDTHAYRPPRRSLRWYAAAIGGGLVAVGAHQLAVTALSQQNQPLSIVVLIGKTTPFWLTLWDVRRSEWFPVIGAVQFTGAVIALELFVAGVPVGVMINPSMRAAFPVIMLLILWSVISVGLRGVERRAFREEQAFLEQHMGTKSSQEDASFLTAKLLSVIQLSLSVFYTACFLATGALWGFPTWHG